jgi:hypothetical protein
MNLPKFNPFKRIFHVPIESPVMVVPRSAESTPEPVTAISLYEPTLDERIAAARIVTNRYRRELYRLERLKAKEQTK